MAAVTGEVTKVAVDKLGRPYLVVNDQEGIREGGQWHIVVRARKDAVAVAEAMRQAKVGQIAHAIGQFKADVVDGRGLPKLSAVRLTLIRVGAEAPKA